MRLKCSHLRIWGVWGMMMMASFSYAACLPLYQEEISKASLLDWKTTYKNAKKIIEDAYAFQNINPPTKENLKITLSLGKFIQDLKKAHRDNPSLLNKIPLNAVSVAEIIKFSDTFEYICNRDYYNQVKNYESLLNEFPFLSIKYRMVQEFERKITEIEEDPSLLKQEQFFNQEIISRLDKIKEELGLKHRSVIAKVMDKFNLVAQDVLTLKQISSLAHSYPETGIVKLVNRACEKGLVKTPRDFLDLFEGVKYYADLKMATVEEFFSMNPSFDEIAAFSHYRVKDVDLKKLIIERGMVHSVDQLLKLYEFYQSCTFDPVFFERFFNYDPAPTAQQVHQLVKCTQYTQMQQIRDQALERGVVRSPSDFLTVFDRGFDQQKVYSFTPEQLEYFFAGNEKPTMGELSELLKRSKNQEPVFNFLFAKSLNDPEIALELIKEIGIKEVPQDLLKQLFFTKSPPDKEKLLVLADLPKDKLFLRLWAYKAFAENYAPTVKDFLILFSGHAPYSLPDDVIEDFFAYQPRPKESDVHRLVALLKPEKYAKVRLLHKKMRQEMEAEIVKSFEQDENCGSNVSSEDLPAENLLQENTAWLKLVNVDKKTCPVCFEEKVDGKFYVCSDQDCSYSNCLECLKESIALQVREKVFPLNCDQCHQNFKLRESDLTELDFKEKSDDIRKGLVLSQYLHDHPKSIACATPDCLNRYPSSEKRDGLDKDSHFDCRFCGEKTCVKCLERHPGKNCDEHQKLKKGDGAFNEMVHDPRSHVRPCPFCHKPQQRGDGCNFVTCPYCKGEWDFVRGKWQKGWSHTYDNVPRTYRIKGEKRLKDGQEYTRYEEGISDDWTKP